MEEEHVVMFMLSMSEEVENCIIFPVSFVINTKESSIWKLKRKV